MRAGFIVACLSAWLAVVVPAEGAAAEACRDLFRVSHWAGTGEEHSAEGLQAGDFYAEAFLTAADVESAEVVKGYTSGWDLQLTLKRKSALKLGENTARAVGHPVGLFLEGELFSTPRIMSPIYGRELSVTGGERGKLQVLAHALSSQNCQEEN